METSALPIPVELLLLNPMRVPLRSNLFSSCKYLLRGISSITANYRSNDRLYDLGIYALVYVDGEYVGTADNLPYEAPAAGSDDPGQSFTFDILANTIGSHEIEFVIVNGPVTTSSITKVEVAANPFLDNTSFLFEVYRGLYNRAPAGFEQAYWVQQLSSGAMTRPQVSAELRTREEFRKATNSIIAPKTVTGNWSTMSDLLGSISSPNNSTDDHADNDANATKVFFNQTIQGRIDYEKDEDRFMINSLTPNGNDGILTVTVLPGHPEGLRYYGIGAGLNTIRVKTNDDQTYVIGSGTYKAVTPGGGFQITFDLSGFQTVESYSFGVRGREVPTGYSSDPYLGSYTIILSNAQAQASEAGFALSMMEELSQSVQSPVNDFVLFNSSQVGLGYIPSILNGSWYIDQYGSIGTHNPEEFFTRLFQNKYEQAPSPVQIARGVEMLGGSTATLDLNGTISSVGFSQQDFLDSVALDNSIMSVGAYNYSGNLAIPNIPLDMAAFAETALVYGALIGKAPTKAEVAKLTMTPQFKVRSLADRARLIMEMPAYASRYGLAMPEVDIVSLGNGDELNASTASQKIRIEAVSLGADNLGGTVDDGNVRAMEIYFNGILKEDNMSNLTDLGLFYEYDVPSDLTSGEYLLEVVAEDANGLRSGQNAPSMCVVQTMPIFL